MCVYRGILPSHVAIRLIKVSVFFLFFFAVCVLISRVGLLDLIESLFRVMLSFASHLTN